MSISFMGSNGVLTFCYSNKSVHTQTLIDFDIEKFVETTFLIEEIEEIENAIA